VTRWWRRVLWQERRSSPLQAGAQALLRAWSEAVRTFGSDQVEMRANALTFRTLLSLVPLLAVAFSIFQAFGGLEASEQALRRLLAQNLAPGSAAAAMQYVRTFVGRISAGAIGGTGVVFLFLTVVSLLSNIEASMNALWGVKRERPFLARFVVYWSAITVGPVLLALSLSMTSAAQSSLIVARLDALVPGASRLLFGLVPWAFSCTALTLLYLIVPHTRVGWRAALGGGLVAGTLWEIGKRAFTWASASLFRYNAVYGSFGALPVFLLWLQVGWMIVLLGCKMGFVLQHSRALREARVQVAVSPSGRQFLALGCMIEIVLAFRQGDPPPTLHDLLPGTRAAMRAEQEVLARLEDVGLVRAVGAEGGDGGSHGEAQGYVPARDPAFVTVEQIVAAFQQDGATPEDLDTGEGTSVLAREVLARARRAAATVTGTLSLAEAASKAADGSKR
jgi:membrane protein